MDHDFEPHAGAFDRAAAQATTCALDRQGLTEQRERHRCLAPSVVRAERDGDLVKVDFAAGFDRRTLDELVAVERECCPFFAFSFDERSRRLEIGVRDHDAAAALDAIADGFSNDRAATNLSARE